MRWLFSPYPQSGMKSISLRGKIVDFVAVPQLLLTVSSDWNWSILGPHESSFLGETEFFICNSVVGIFWSIKKSYVVVWKCLYQSD